MTDVDALIASRLIQDAHVARPETWQYKVLMAIADRSERGATDLEIADLLQAPGGASNLRARRVDLVTRGLVRDSGQKRATSSGSQARVWTLSDSIRSSLTARIDLHDCDLLRLASGSRGGDPLAVEIADLDDLRARLALIARQARAAVLQQNHPVSVAIDAGTFAIVASRPGSGPERIKVEIRLDETGLRMRLLLRKAGEDAGSVIEQSVMAYRSALANLDHETLEPLTLLLRDGWVAESDIGGQVTEASDISEWVLNLATQPDADGLLHRFIPGVELEDMQAGVVRPITALISAAMSVEDAVNLALHDPVSELADKLFWPESRARQLVDLASRTRQILFTGPPGTGKTFAARILTAALSDSSRSRFVQFHPTYAYEDFVEGIRPVIKRRADLGGSAEDAGLLHYEVRPGIFRDVVDQALNQPEDSCHFLIIDEINRANLPRVLGELLFALEYRGPENVVELPYSGDELFVPNNLWLIGTMNTADRSVALMDAAMRRRFKEFRFDVDYEALRLWHERHTSSALGLEAVSRLRRLNDLVIELLDEDRTLGQSFLMLSNLPIIGFETVWREDLEPVLRDHLLGRVDDLPDLRKAFLGDL